MRIIILSVVSLFLSICAASAQDWRLKPEIKNDSSFVKKSKPEWQIPEFRSSDTMPDQWISHDTTGSITYPGSSRYYSKRAVNPYFTRHFVKTPDNSVKQYLIIKDPLTQKVSR